MPGKFAWNITVSPFNSNFTVLFSEAFGLGQLLWYQMCRSHVISGPHEHTPSFFLHCKNAKCTYMSVIYWTGPRQHKPYHGVCWPEQLQPPIEGKCYTIPPCQHSNKYSYPSSGPAYERATQRRPKPQRLFKDAPTSILTHLLTYSLGLKQGFLRQARF